MTFGDWQTSADALWRRRESLRAAGIDPETDDAYVGAWCAHHDTSWPPYPGMSVIGHSA